MDPFATLGLPRTFDVDLAAVEKMHRELSRALHPDKFVNAGASERKAALGKAVEVNEAWRIVRDPIRRAEALLVLAGVTRAHEESTHSSDQEFLMDMLEQREALAEAKQAKDLARVHEMARAIEARSKSTERALSEGLADGRVTSPPMTLVHKLEELRFYRRFLDEVSAIEDELAA